MYSLLFSNAANVWWCHEWRVLLYEYKHHEVALRVFFVTWFDLLPIRSSNESEHIIQVSSWECRRVTPSLMWSEYVCESHSNCTEFLISPILWFVAVFCSSKAFPRNCTEFLISPILWFVAVFCSSKAIPRNFENQFRLPLNPARSHDDGIRHM